MALASRTTSPYQDLQWAACTTLRHHQGTPAVPAPTTTTLDRWEWADFDEAACSTAIARSSSLLRTLKTLLQYSSNLASPTMDLLFKCTLLFILYSRAGLFYFKSTGISHSKFLGEAV